MNRAIALLLAMCSVCHSKILDPCAAAGYRDDVALDSTQHRMTTATHMQLRKKRAAARDDKRRWPNAIIPYQFADRFTGLQKAVVIQAMQAWENSSCIRFAPKENQTEFVYFQRKGNCGCCSFVGRLGNGNAQGLNLGQNCIKVGTVMHELGHLLGFWHEHARPDRDKYVKVVYKNIRAGEAKNFRRLSFEKVDSLGVRYDYNSVMHYSRSTFSRTGFESTIVPLSNAALFIGQRSHLSRRDIKQANLLYKCPTCGQTFTSSSGRLSFFSDSSPLQGARTCVWHIQSPTGQGLEFVFNYTYFHFRCGKVYMEVRRGSNADSPLVGRYCSQILPPRVIRIRTSSLWIKFHYGHKYFYDDKPIGFDGMFTAQCGGILKEDRGRISSSNYPNNGDLHTSCEWDIVATKGRRIVLSFRMLRFDADPSCKSDRLELIDKETNKILGIICRSQMQDDIIASNHVIVKFTAGKSIHDVGFLLTYSSEKDMCSSNNGGCSHICHQEAKTSQIQCSCSTGSHLAANGRDCEYRCGGRLSMHAGMLVSPGFPGSYPARQRCVWSIVAKPKQVIALRFDLFQLETSQVCGSQYDHVAITDSGLHRSTILCGRDGQGLVYYSSTNSIQVVFSSDSTITGKGFKAHYMQVDNACSIGNGGCDHICKMSNTGKTCQCRDGFQLARNGKTCQQAACDRHLTRSHGWLASEDHLTSCTWTVNTTEGQSYRVKFTSIMVSTGQGPQSSCDDHAIRIYSYDKTWQAQFEYCNGQLNDRLLLPGNRMKVTFQRAQNAGYFAFNLSYSSVCGGLFYASRQPRYIYSHADYDVISYPPSQNCTWHIYSRKGRRSRVLLQIRRLAVEGGSCNYDYVKIYDGKTTRSPLLATLCGSKTERLVYRSTGSDMLVQFVSDTSVGRAGFWMEYSKLRSRNKRGYLQLFAAHHGLKRPNDRLFD